jgi:hypothetical protein
MNDTSPNRIRFRFSLRSLFVIVAISAAVAAWYAHRLRVISAERERLAGQWRYADGRFGTFSDVPTDVGLPADGIRANRYLMVRDMR